MTLGTLSRWLDIRPEETRSVGLSFVGAFLVISFLILARSLREALYLTTFPVETLPYITGSVALLSVPTVALFARILSRSEPQGVLRALLLGLAGGLLVLWPVVTRNGAAVVVFYLWTALGTLLLTSAFWLVTAELFALRDAKRLFGLIGAGGTAGAMVTGNSVAWVTTRVSLTWLIPALVGLLLLFLLTQHFLPRGRERAASEGDRGRLGEGLALVWRTPHLRTIAAIVLTATVVSTLVDYQFKELAQASFGTREGLAGFFGAFYGWTGAVALVLQIVGAARLLMGLGVASTLSILPLFLVLGAAGLFLLPGLALATAVRGADSSLRKSLHRSALEVLYLPVSSTVRRRTKTFIDSVVDSGAEAVGAAIVFLWVTLPGLPSRYLSLFALPLAGLFLYLSRRMGRRYLATVTDRLKAGGERVAGDWDRRDLLSGGFTIVDLRPSLDESGATTATAELSTETLRAARAAAFGSEEEGAPGPIAREAEGAPAPRPGVAASMAAPRAARAPPGRGEAVGAFGPEDPTELLASPHAEEVAEALDRIEVWEERHVPLLTRLLARDALYGRVVRILAGIPELSVPHLVRLVRDEETDFVIRRRIPRVLALCGGLEADRAVLDALGDLRFEVRYRAAIALVRRRRRGLPTAGEEAERAVWNAVRREVSRGRPVWELQRVLDERDFRADGIVADRLDVRGELSLEHTFRLLSLVCESEAVRAAFRGVLADDRTLSSLALEYLEHVLPADVRERLWPFIGDLSERQRRKATRPLDEVVADLVTTGATLFGSEEERGALRRLLEEER